MANVMELDGWVAGPGPGDGEVRPVDGRFELRLTRDIARPVEKVWAALTIPERVADWFGEATFDLRVGGRYALQIRGETGIMEGAITAYEPPRLLEYIWTNGDGGPSTVRMELTPLGQGCRLVFTQNRMIGRRLVDTASGWHGFLDLIPTAADGQRAEHDHEGWKALDARYEAWLGPIIAKS